MNTLSWLILFGGFVDRLSNSLIPLIVLIGFAVFISTIVCAVSKSTEKENYHKGYYPYNGSMEIAKKIYNEHENTLYTPWHKKNKFGAIIFFVLIGLFTITPTKKDITLVAASEIGERVIKSDTVNKLVDPSIEYLNEWIKTELSNLKENRNNNNGKK